MAKRLNELVKGDKVAYTNEYYSIGWGGSYIIWQPAVVEKDTDTQITVNGKRFLRRNGIRIGDNSRRPCRISPWSEEIEKEIEETNAVIAEHKDRQSYLGIIESVRIRDLSTDKLRRISEIIRLG